MRLSVAFPVASLLIALGSGCTTEPAKAAATPVDAGQFADTSPALDGTGTAPDATADDGVKGPPKANVFPEDPVTDKNKTSVVALDPPTAADGHLTGPSVEVRNCLTEEGGPPLKQGKYEIGNMCHEVQTVVPDADGNYLSVLPPADWSDANDPFAEVQMYFHVSKIHDYFHDGFGLTDLDFPLPAIVNVSMYIKEEIAAMMGAKGGWQGFPNAAFIPPEGFAQFGLPKVASGAIVFGHSGETDFSYDASVIYHEYTHAIVGTTRLAGMSVDSFGLDNLPGAMNEGFADYFSCSLRNDPKIGAYALSTVQGRNLERDLSIAKKCPDDLTTEIHADGKIIGSALWEVRTALGASTADGIVLKALQSFTASTSLYGAGKLLVAAAKTVDSKTSTKVKEILAKHGIMDCQRAKLLTDFDMEQSEEQVPYTVEGVGGNSGNLPDGMPGYLQFYIDVPPGQMAIEVAWQAQSQTGGPSLPLNLAVSGGKPVAFTGDGSIMADAKLEITPESKGGWQRAVLTGGCLPVAGGRIYLMFLNPGSNAMAITGMETKLLKSTAGLKNVKTCM